MIKILKLKQSKGKQHQPFTSQEQLNKLFSKMVLSGADTWSAEEQEDIRTVITEFGFLFPLDNMDLGKASVVKHSIKLTGYTPFKE